MSLETKLQYIYMNFGKVDQLMKDKEEVLEYCEAMYDGEAIDIKQELADTFVVQAQFDLDIFKNLDRSMSWLQLRCAMHGFEVNEIMKIVRYKVDRTIERIGTNYYEAM